MPWILLSACSDVRLALSPAAPLSTDDLEAVIEGELPAGATLGWWRDGVLQDDLAAVVISAQHTARGESWHATVQWPGGSASSEAVTIGNSPPVVDEVEILPAAPAAGVDALTCQPIATDPDGDALTITTSWQLDGVEVEGSDTLSAIDTLSATTVSCTATASDGTASSAPVSASVTLSPIDAPFGEQLLENGDFEAGALEGWTVQLGGCGVTEGLSWIDPYDGAWFFHGGDTSDCLASQDIDLLAAGFPASLIDAGLQVSLSSWVASAEPADNFDDQVLLRVRYQDSSGALISSLETMMGAGESWLQRQASGLIPAGTRSLQVQIEGRYRKGTSNDTLADEVDLRIFAAAPSAPTITGEPMLQDYRTDGMRLLWLTDGNLAEHGVRWGEGEEVSALRTVQVDTDRYVHIAEISGLRAGESYPYTVFSGESTSATHTLQTAPEAGAAVRIGWMGDNQDGPETFATHISHLSARAPDMLLVAGDIVQEADAVEEWISYWWSPLQTDDFAARTPVLIARGNHDREHPYAYAYTALPGNGAWYSFTYGAAFFVVLDTQSALTSTTTALDQRAFLADALSTEEATSADFRIVVFHQAPYTNTFHGTASDGNSEVREQWVEELVAGGVDVVVAGHYHAYQRGELDGVMYVVTGGGGASLDSEIDEVWDFFDIAALTWHYAVMDIEEGSLTWRTYDDQDVLFDEFTLTAR